MKYLLKTDTACEQLFTDLKINRAVRKGNAALVIGCQ
jgi:hypothetical protein